MDLLKVFIPNYLQLTYSGIKTYRASLDFGGFIFGWKVGKAGKLGFG